MTMKTLLTILSLTFGISAWAAISDLKDVKVEICGNLKLKREFSLTKLDPLYFMNGFKKIDVADLGNGKYEVKVLFNNEIFNEESLEDAEKLLQKELNKLTSLPHQLTAGLNSKSTEATCVGERKPHSGTSQISPEFAFESVRSSMIGIAAFHMASLQGSEMNKDDLVTSFNRVRMNVEGTMDKIFTTEKKTTAQREELLKKYNIAKKDLDAREALLKSLDLLDEASSQLKRYEVKENKKMSTRLSVEKEGLAYIITVEKI